MFVSHAQNFEDVILWRALKDVENGFYIDVGANDPEIDSVSCAFYEHGWRGVHVEPLKFFADRLRSARPDEEVVEACIAETTGTLQFFNIGNGGLSTARNDLASSSSTALGLPVTSETVPCLRLSALLDRYGDRTIHWLKIDVEGYERDVLSSWVGSCVRPWVVVVECMPLTRNDTSPQWQHIIEGLDYTQVYFDGLNKFFLSQKKLDLLPHFSHGPCVFDNFALSGTSSGGFTRLLTDTLSRQRTQAAQVLSTLVAATPGEQAAIADLAAAASAFGPTSRPRIELGRIADALSVYLAEFTANLGAQGASDLAVGQAGLIRDLRGELLRIAVDGAARSVDRLRSVAIAVDLARDAVRAAASSASPESAPQLQPRLEALAGQLDTISAEASRPWTEPNQRAKEAS